MSVDTDDQNSHVLRYNDTLYSLTKNLKNYSNVKATLTFGEGNIFAEFLLVLRGKCLKTGLWAGYPDFVPDKGNFFFCLTKHPGRSWSPLILLFSVCAGILSGG